MWMAFMNCCRVRRIDANVSEKAMIVIHYIDE